MGAEEELDELTRRKVDCEGRINRLHVVTLAILRKDWNDAEIHKAGLL